MAQWWWDRPYRIGCLTGESFDAIELPAWLGTLVLPTVAHAATAWEVHTGTERVWRFLVTSGSPVVFEFRHMVPQSRLHTSGALLVLPPILRHDGTKDEACRWVARQPGPNVPLRLPHALNVQWAAIQAIRTAGPSDTR